MSRGGRLARVAAAPERRPGDRAKGIAMVLVATLAWSFSGLYTRLLDTDIYSAIAWRCFFGATFLLPAFLYVHRGQALRRITEMGWQGPVVLVLQIVSMAATVGGLFLTSVANVTVIYSTSPFLAAGFAWWLLGERADRRTLVASAIVLVGVLVVVSGSAGEGRLLGDLLALSMTVTFAAIIVVPRLWPHIDLLTASMLGGYGTFLVFLPFASTASIGLETFAILAAYGFTNFVIAYFVFLKGSRLISAAESGLIITLEIVLAPLWVWLAFDEVPGTASFIGGGLILATITWHLLSSLRAR
jgi:drug/metabolite transporter (DMT)-like permease